MKTFHQGGCNDYYVPMKTSLKEAAIMMAWPCQNLCAFLYCSNCCVLRVADPLLAMGYLLLLKMP